jgi:molybdenum cofactor cytidylyltransferase
VTRKSVEPDSRRGPGAVVLAAGASSRMGTPKALLLHQGRTFLERWLDALGAAGVVDVRIVLGRDGEVIRRRVPLPEHHVVINPAPERGMLSSFRIGIAALPPGVAGYLLCPVDHPAVGSELIGALAARLEPGRIVVPIARGRRGHPVLFAAGLRREIEAAPASEGARAVVRADPARVIEVVAPPEVLLDIDTPEDYRRLEERDSS